MLKTKFLKGFCSELRSIITDNCFGVSLNFKYNRERWYCICSCSWRHLGYKRELRISIDAYSHIGPNIGPAKSMGILSQALVAFGQLWNSFTGAGLPTLQTVELLVSCAMYILSAKWYRFLHYRWWYRHLLDRIYRWCYSIPLPYRKGDLSL